MLGFSHPTLAEMLRREAAHPRPALVPGVPCSVAGFRLDGAPRGDGADAHESSWEPVMIEGVYGPLLAVEECRAALALFRELLPPGHVDNVRFRIVQVAFTEMVVFLEDPV